MQKSRPCRKNNRST